jgi:DNA-binding NarL/FixJ family response regulator
MTDEPVRVLVADAHPVFRHGLSALLDSVADIEVVGESADGGETISAVSALRPHVVLMDVQMPGGDTPAEIMGAIAGVAILVLTMCEDDAVIFAAIRAGARGYLHKRSTGADVVRGLRAVAQGEMVFGCHVADRVIAFFTAQGHCGLTPFPQLTDREREVLRLVARGLDNATIARRLSLSQKTVRNRVSGIFTKLQVAGRPQAIAAARDAGIGTAP